jgi:acetyl esterase
MCTAHGALHQLGRSLIVRSLVNGARVIGTIVILAASLCASGAGTTPTRIEKIAGSGGPLIVRIFEPPNDTPGTRAAIRLIHGGGWTTGDASWMDSDATPYASLGMLALSLDYRLSDGLTVTPFDALEDVRTALRWMRAQSNRLRIDPNKIAVLGESAGGHRAASAAVFSEPYGSDISAKPNVLILSSPAVSVAQLKSFQKLSGGPAQAASLSPDLPISGNMPPTFVLQGEKDSVNPAEGVIAFCERMVANNNICVLKVYKDVGHMFTRNLLQQDDYASIDQDVSRQASEASVSFLRALGFVK